jgi:energy-coupling factor transport system permease protein
VRGLRDWLPIFVPLLVSGLERSMGLAEAMVARGYGSVSDRAQSLRTQALLALGLLTVLGGWLAFLLLPSWREPAVVAMVAGAGIIAGVVWLAGSSVSHTAYHRRRWTTQDALTVVGCALTLAVTLSSRSALYYSPYPQLTLPPFDPLIGLGLLGLVVPALISDGGHHDRTPSPGSDRQGTPEREPGQEQQRT